MPATVWQGRLAFGLVSIPIRLHKAARRERIRFHRVYRPAETQQPEIIEQTRKPKPPLAGTVHEMPAPPAAGPTPAETVARVRNQPVGEWSEAPLEKPQVLKGYEIEKDRYVTFEPRELAALRPPTSTELPITEFVRLEEIDPIFFETSYYAAPDRGGDKPYALLYRALRETGYAGLGSLAMHGREHAAIIRPGRRGLILHTLFFNNEVRAAQEFAADPALVNPKELELAALFVRALAAKFDPETLKDTFEERLREFVQTRAHTAVATRRPESAPRAPVIDIMEALRKSLEMTRKPPARAGAKPAKPRRQKRS